MILYWLKKKSVFVKMNAISAELQIQDTHEDKTKNT